MFFHNVPIGDPDGHGHSVSRRNAPSEKRLADPIGRNQFNPFCFAKAVPFLERVKNNRKKRKLTIFSIIWEYKVEWSLLVPPIK
jgi:hypothetical protein